MVERSTKDMIPYKSLDTFRFWCQKVLPLVYDNSLSYYEVLCKVVKYINDLIDADKIIKDNLEELQKELNEVQKFIDNFDTDFAREVLEKYIATMIFVEITDSGYIVYNIPSSWNNITFNTTGLDIEVPIQPEYGHLVLSY